jgi:hypothetical protein
MKKSSEGIGRARISVLNNNNEIRDGRTRYKKQAYKSSYRKKREKKPYINY